MTFDLVNGVALPMAGGCTVATAWVMWRRAWDAASGWRGLVALCGAALLAVAGATCMGVAWGLV